MSINIFQLVLFSYIAFHWTFSLLPDDSFYCDATEEGLEQWKRFKFFMIVECLIFISNVFGSIVFMFFRSISHIQQYWDIEENDKWEE